MSMKHSDIIQRNLSTLVDNTDLTRIVPHLERQRVLNQEAIKRILDPSHDVKLQTTNLYTAVVKRGPHAFAKMRDALRESNHTDLADLLTQMDAQVNRRPSLNSVGSWESVNSLDSELDRTNAERTSPEAAAANGTAHPAGSPPTPVTSDSSNGAAAAAANRVDSFNTTTSGSSASPDTTPDTSGRLVYPDARRTVEPCNLPEQYKGLKEFMFGPNLSKSDLVNIRIEEQLPVKVRTATVWKDVGPFHYKMNSYPRGLALIVNNVEFDDILPRRNGAHNDQRRLLDMLEQFYFDVEFHENQTRTQMIEIVRNFAKRKELRAVDCVLVVFMSHGSEGASEEDTEIIGVDGIGYKTREIVGQFSNDRCKALINKPKVFIFQACRGTLPDEGVLMPHRFVRPSKRIETDGRKIEGSDYLVRIRSSSDVFIAYAVPPGRPANRDIYNGTWFIQTIVDVFSENAWEHDLEDMLKMVDYKIKNLNNAEVRNFQAVATMTVGWNKKLYFNPGLRMTKEEDVKTCDGERELTGTDVVDVCPRNEDAPERWSRRRREEGDSSGGSCRTRGGCFSMPKCFIS